MRIAIILMSVFLISSFKTDPKSKEIINILLIGNDGISYNNMPQILEKMLNGREKNYTVSQSTFFQVSLNDHFNKKCSINETGGSCVCPLESGENSATEKLITSRIWNYVFLQELTRNVVIPETRTQFVIPTIKAIQDKHKNNVLEFVLFKTWPGRNKVYPKQHCFPHPELSRLIKKDTVCTPIMNSLDEESALINSAYDSIAIATNLPSVPITKCFTEIIKNHPNINLYDGMEPSIYGAYLNACVLYKYITKQKANTIKYTANLDTKTIHLLQDVVDKNMP